MPWAAARSTSSPRSSTSSPSPAYALAQSFWAFVVAGALMGVFRALDSGPLEAWFVDTVHETTPGADVDRPAVPAPGRSSVSRSPWGRCSPACSSGGTRSPPSPATRTPRRSTSRSGCRWPFAWCTSSCRPSCCARTGPTSAPSAPASRTRWARRARPPWWSRAGWRSSAATGCCMGIVAVEVFWSIGMITFESFMPLRLEEMVGSAQEAGALVGPVSAAGWGLFSVGAWLAGTTSTRDRGGPGRRSSGGCSTASAPSSWAWSLGPAGLIAAYLFTYSMHGHERPAARGAAAPRGGVRRTAPPCSRSTR